MLLSPSFLRPLEVSRGPLRILTRGHLGELGASRAYMLIGWIPGGYFLGGGGGLNLLNKGFAYCDSIVWIAVYRLTSFPLDIDSTGSLASSLRTASSFPSCNSRTQNTPSPILQTCPFASPLNILSEIERTCSLLPDHASTRASLLNLPVLGHVRALVIP